MSSKRRVTVEVSGQSSTSSGKVSVARSHGGHHEGSAKDRDRERGRDRERVQPLSVVASVASSVQKPRASVFSRLGTKGGQSQPPPASSSSTGSYPEDRVDGATKQKVGFPQGAKKSASEWKRERKLKGGAKPGSTVAPPTRDRDPRRDPKQGGVPGREGGSPKIDISWENWDEQKLDYDDELMLEKKRQMLERELAKHGDEGPPPGIAALGGAADLAASRASEAANRKRKLDQPPQGKVPAPRPKPDHPEKARTGRGPESDSESAASSVSPSGKGGATRSSSASSVGSAQAPHKRPKLQQQVNRKRRGQRGKEVRDAGGKRKQSSSPESEMKDDGRRHKDKRRSGEGRDKRDEKNPKDKGKEKKSKERKRTKSSDSKQGKGTSESRTEKGSSQPPPSQSSKDQADLLRSKPDKLDKFGFYCTAQPQGDAPASSSKASSHVKPPGPPVSHGHRSASVERRDKADKAAAHKSRSRSPRQGGSSAKPQQPKEGKSSPGRSKGRPDDRGRPPRGGGNAGADRDGQGHGPSGGRHREATPSSKSESRRDQPRSGHKSPVFSQGSRRGKEDRDYALPRASSRDRDHRAPPQPDRDAGHRRSGGSTSHHPPSTSSGSHGGRRESDRDLRAEGGRGGGEFDGGFAPSSRDRDLRREIDDRRAAPPSGGRAGTPPPPPRSGAQSGDKRKSDQDRTRYPPEEHDRSGHARGRGDWPPPPPSERDRDRSTSQGDRRFERGGSVGGGASGHPPAVRDEWERDRRSPGAAQGSRRDWDRESARGAGWRPERPERPAEPETRGFGGPGSGGGRKGRGFPLTGSNSVQIDRVGFGGALGGGRDRDRDRGSGRRSPLAERLGSLAAGSSGSRRARSKSGERLLPPQALQALARGADRRSSRERSLPEAERPSSERPVSAERDLAQKHASSQGEKKRSGSRDATSVNEAEDVGSESCRPEQAPFVKEEGEVEDPPATAVESSSASGVIPEDQRHANKRTEGEKEFSDFSESDEEILNKEESQLTPGSGPLRKDHAEDREASGSSRPSSRRSRSDPETAKDSDVLEGISDEDLELSEDDDAKKSKAKFADALGVDWSQLVIKPAEENPAEEGALKKRWSLAAMLSRVGLSERMMGGKSNYDAFIAEINEGLPDEEQFRPCHPVAAMDVYLREKAEQRSRIFRDLGDTRALSARKDLAIRRQLCDLGEHGTGGEVLRFNTSMSSYEMALQLYNDDQRRMNV